MSSHFTLASYAVSLVINLMIVGTFFAVGIALAFRLVQQISPRVRYIIAVIAFLAAAALPINSTLFASRETAVAFQVDAAIDQQQQSSTAVLDQSRKSAVDNSDGRNRSDQSRSLTTEPQPTGSIQIGSRMDALVRTLADSWLGAAFVVMWVFVAALLLGREVLGYIHLARARHTWRLADENMMDEMRWRGAYPLFISEHEGPCTVGLVRPAVVIPGCLLDEISLDAVRLIARHELAHARWRDPLVNALVRIISAILWPSLPLFYLGRVVGAEREAASDFSAVAAFPDDIKGTVLEYATLLLLVARRPGKKSRHRRYQLAATEAGSHTDLEARVVRLLKISSRPTRAGVLVAAFALIATAWGASRLPIAARPLTVTAMAQESDTASANQEVAAPATAYLSIVPAAQDESFRSQDKEQLIQKYTGLETYRAEAQSSAQEQIHNSAGLMSTPQTVLKTEGEISQDFVDEMAALGYANLSPDQLAAMKAHGVSQAYIKEMAASGYNRLTADALINFRWLGISSAYIKDLSGLGYVGLSANTMIDFRLYGVTPAYINEMAALGFANLDAKTLVAFRRLSINPEYVKELKATGDEHLSAAQLIQRRSQKVAVVESGKRGNGQND